MLIQPVSATTNSETLENFTTGHKLQVLIITEDLYLKKKIQI